MAVQLGVCPPSVELRDAFDGPPDSKYPIGQGLFSRKAFSEGDEVFVDAAGLCAVQVWPEPLLPVLPSSLVMVTCMVTGQHLDNQRVRKACGNSVTCMRPLGGARYRTVSNHLHALFCPALTPGMRARDEVEHVCSEASSAAIVAAAAR